MSDIFAQILQGMQQNLNQQPQQTAQYKGALGAAYDNGISTDRQYADQVGKREMPAGHSYLAMADSIGPSKSGNAMDDMGGIWGALRSSRAADKEFEFSKQDKMYGINSGISKLQAERATAMHGADKEAVDYQTKIGNSASQMQNAQWAQQEQPFRMKGLELGNNINQMNYDNAVADQALPDANVSKYITGDEFDADAFYTNELGVDGAGPEAKQRRAAANQYLINKAKTKNPNSGRPKDVGTLKFIRDQDGIASAANRRLKSLEGIDNALDASNSGLFADQRNFVESFYNEDVAKSRQAINTMAGISLEEVSEYLKPMSEADANWAKERLGGANAAPAEKKQALKIVRHGIAIKAAEANAAAKAAREGVYYETDIQEYIANDPKVRQLYDTMPSAWVDGKPDDTGVDIEKTLSGLNPEMSAMAKDAIAKGADPKKVLERINSMGDKN